jgi:hypothetical protein
MGRILVPQATPTAQNKTNQTLKTSIMMWGAHNKCSRMGGRQSQAAAEAVVFPLAMMVSGSDDNVCSSRKLFLALDEAE